MSKTTIIGDTICFRGVPVATITVAEGSVRADFEEEILDYGSDEWDRLHSDLSEKAEEAYRDGWEEARKEFASEAAA